MADLGGGLLEPGGGQREELKTQFMTREGTYHLMALAEYTRPNRLGYNNQPANGSVPVKVVRSWEKAAGDAGIVLRFTITNTWCVNFASTFMGSVC